MRDGRLALALAIATIAMITTLGAQQGPPRDQPVAPLVGTAIISGTVAAAGDGARPIGNAQLLIVGTDTGYIKITQADEQGRFSLADLPAGRYLLGATKASYLNTAYGAKRPGRPGTAISLTDGQKIQDIVLTLTLGGVMSGVITDERGQPAPGAVVRLEKVETKPGGSPTSLGGLSMAAMMQQMTSENGRTDDRGVYRLFGVEPGEYTIVVTPPNNGAAAVRVTSAEDIQAGLQALREPGGPDGRSRSAPPTPSTILPPASLGGLPPGAGIFPQSMMSDTQGNGPTAGYAPVYYPGSPEIAEASTVTIKAGEERDGLDIRTRLVPMARVECQVIVPDGQSAASPQVTLQPIGNGSTSSLLAVLVTGQRLNARPGPDRRFTFTGVAPGRYTLVARTYPALTNGVPGSAPPDPTAPPPPVPLWAMTEVTVSGEDVTGLVLTLQPGMSLSGRVVFNGEKPEPKDLQLMVGVQPIDNTTSGLIQAISGGASGSAKVKADHTFTITGLMPSRYLLFGVVAPSGIMDVSAMFEWSVQSVMVGGRELLDLPIDLEPGDEVKDAVITFTDRQQEVIGTLQDTTGRPAPDYTVVLFATDKRYWTSGSRRIVTARPATDGRFELGGSIGSLGPLTLGAGGLGLPAGEYYLAAVTDLAGGEEQDPTLLEELSKAAVKITVAPGETKRQDLRIAGGPL
jgi:hypothetical protein